MSDFINNQQQFGANVDFNAYLHTKEICDGSSIRMSQFTLIKYKSGWADIVKQMLLAIKSADILVNSILSEYGQLDVHFDCTKKAHELKVWREIELARIHSRKICMECGEDGNRKIQGDKVIVICRQCILKAENSGETGTWLDKY